MIHDIFIVVIRILRIQRFAAQHKALLVMRFPCMSKIVALGKAFLVLPAPGVILLDMVVVLPVALEPLLADLALLCIFMS